jgi:transketolase
MVSRALKAWELLKERGIFISVLNVASIRPFPEEDLIKASSFKNILVVEDHLVATGLGVHIASFFAQKGLTVNLKLLGHKEPASSGHPDELFKRAGLDPESIAKSMIDLIHGS